MNWTDQSRRDLSPDSRGTVAFALAVLCITLAFAGGVGLAGAQDSTSGLAVQNSSTNSPVVAGESATVTAEVTNEGRTAYSQDIELAIDGRLTDSTAVSLEPGDTRTVDLTWDTTAEDVGSHNATVSSENDTASVDVVVEGTAGPFTVGILSTNSPVVEGGVLMISTEVTNEGSAAGSQEIELTIGGKVIDSTTVSLDSGQPRTVDLTWATGAGDAGTHTANVSTTDDSGDTEVQVESDNGSADFIRIYTQPTDTAVGDPIGGPPTVEVTDTFGNPVPNVTVEVSLSADASSALFGTLSVRTDGEGRATFDDLLLDALGSYQLVFRVPEHSLDTSSATFAVIDDTPPSARLTVPDTAGVGEEIQLDASESSDNVEIVRYEWDFGDGTTIEGENLTQPTHTYTEAGAYVVAVTVVDTSGNENTASQAVSSEGNVCSGQGECSVEITGTNSPVTIGDRDAHNLEINATVRNTGARPGQQTITLSVGAIERDSREVELAAGESRQLTMHWAVTEDDIGNYTAVVSASNYSDSRPVRVRADTAPPTVGQIEFVPCNPECDGDPIVATENDSTPENLTQDQSYRIRSDASDPDGSVESYEWTVDGEIVSSAETFEYTFESTGEHTVSVTVMDGEGATVTVPIEVEELASDEDDPDQDQDIELHDWIKDINAGDADTPIEVGEERELTIETDATDPDGNITVESYEWTVDGDPAGSGASISYIFDSAGDHQVAVTITDGDGSTATIEQTVSVEPAGNDGIGGLLPILLGLLVLGVLLGGGGYYLTRGGNDADYEKKTWGNPTGDPDSDGGDGGHTQHDEFDSEDRMQENDSGGGTNDDDYNETETIIDPEPGGGSDAGEGEHMDPSDSAFPPFTATGGATDSGGDDDDYNETETIIDPEPGGGSDAGEGEHMDPSDSAFPPFTDTGGATDSGGDDDDYNETETIIDPEPGGATDAGEGRGQQAAGNINPPAAINKAELIDSIASEADITKANARENMDAFIDTTTKALKKGNRVAMVGIGTFDPITQAGTAEGDTASRDTAISFTPSSELVSAQGDTPPGGYIDPETVDDIDTGASADSGASEGTDVIYGKYAGTEYADTPYLSNEERAAALSALVASTANALAAGQPVEFGELGSLHPGSGPGEPADAAGTTGVKFKPGAELSDKIK